MSADESRRPVRRARPVKRADLPPGAARELRDALYELYLRADAPTLDELADQIAAADDLPGSPGRDVIGGLVAGRALGRQEDAVSLAVALNRRGTGQDSAAVARRVRELWVAAGAAPPPADEAGIGQPVAAYALDPYDLGIHAAIEVEGDPRAGLPFYAARDHDRRLAQVVDAARGGRSAIAVLVGNTATGKSRACWEAVRALPPDWRLWQPPGTAAALLAGVPRVRARTVVWLDELDDHLTADSVAALRELLADAGRAPVLVLGTIWKDKLAALTVADRLLRHRTIEVPDGFTGAADLTALAEAARHDPRVREAEHRAANGRVTQYLAGVEELKRVYERAPEPAKSLLHVAMDLRRHAVKEDPPAEFLRDAVVDYVDDTVWAEAGDGWLAQALEYTAKPLKGVRGPLAPARPRVPGVTAAARGYRLADHFAQNARDVRAGAVPPASFWSAAETHLDAHSRAILARAALDLGLLRVGARLRRHSRSPDSWHLPGELLELVADASPDTLRQAAAWVNAHVDPADTRTVTEVSTVLTANGLDDLLAALHLRVARELPLDRAVLVADTIEMFEEFGRGDAVRALVDRDPASRVTWPAGDFGIRLDATLRSVGADHQAAKLDERAAADRAARRDEWAPAIDRLDPADTRATVTLLHKADDDPVLVQRIADRDVAGRASLDDAGDLLWLLIELHRHVPAHAERLLDRIRQRVADAPIGWLVDYETMRGELHHQLAALDEVLPPARPTFAVTPEHLTHVWWLAGHCTTPEEGAVLVALVRQHLPDLPASLVDQVAATVREVDPALGDALIRDIARTARLTEPLLVAGLLTHLRGQGDDDAVTALLARVGWARAAANPNRAQVAALITALGEAGRPDLVSRLVHERLAAGHDCVRLLDTLAAHGPPGDALLVAEQVSCRREPYRAIEALRWLHRHDLAEPAARLAERIATETAPIGLAVLVDALAAFQELGLAGAAARMLARDPVGGMARILIPRKGGRIAELLLHLHELPDPVAKAQLDRLVARIVDEPRFVAPTSPERLADALRQVGAADAVPRLARRLADAGYYPKALRLDPEAARRFRYGREPDGSPSTRWGWDDLA